MEKSSHQDKLLLACYLTFVCALYLGAFLSGCTSVSPAKVSTQDYAIMNLQDELDRALARGDKLKKLPHGDFSWDWCKPGENWDFQRWHYEIVRHE